MEETEKTLDQEIHELVTQLTDLAKDRKSFFRDDGDDEVFREDFNALIRAADLLEILLMDSKNCSGVLEALSFYEDTGLEPKRCAELAEALSGEANADARTLFEKDMLLYERDADNPPDLLYKSDTEKLSCMANWRKRAAFLRLLFPKAERALEGRQSEGYGE